MDFKIRNKLVYTKGNEKVLVGFGITLGGSYTCSVTLDKAKELGVKDVSIAHLMDFDEIEVVPIGTKSYGVVSNNSGFFEEFADSPMDYFGDKKLYYGYYFEDRYIVNLDSTSALDRMILEAEGVYKDV